MVMYTLQVYRHKYVFITWKHMAKNIVCHIIYACKLTMVRSLEFVFVKFLWISLMLIFVIYEFKSTTNYA